ncbi:thermonuclease family protein [Phycisphaerales bacterium AB-hyl4]|uniref:Thermonuclease family protein n=1 Tax=Natronomicrosphaera hydrolytica TaxID=3242702 RepID=A0ABV4UAF3_9BACT
MAFLHQRQRKRRIIAVVAVAALAIAVLADRSGLLLHQGDDRSRYDTRTFAVVQVISGDTLEIDAPDGNRPTTRVRLWGITAPANAQPERGRPDPEPLADEAAAFVREQVGDRPVRLETESHRVRNRDGELLAHVYVDDHVSLNAQLLSAGLASVNARWSHDQLERYAEHEAEARAAGRGIWADASR